MSPPQDRTSDGRRLELDGAMGRDRLPGAELALLLIESAPDALIVADRDGTIVRINRRVIQLFGYGEVDLVGRAIEVLLPAGSRQAHRNNRVVYAQNPTARPMGSALDLWGRRADGAEFPIEVSLSPCDVGEEHLVIATVRDISARRRAEQVQRNLLQMLEGITEAVYLIDPDTLTITYVNAAACRQTGCTAEELLGRSPAQVLVAFDLVGFRTTVAPLLAGRTASLMVSTPVRHRNGTSRSTECDISLPEALRGQPASLVAVVRDISDREAREAQVRATDQLLTLLDERARIARDLHDTVIQDLFASGLALQAIALRCPPDIQGRLSVIIDRQDATIGQIRTTIFGLGAHDAQDSLLAMVHTVIDDAARILPCRPSFRTSGAIDTAATPELVEHLLPTLRESLSNVARHAHATRVDVELTLRNDVVTLHVSDNGVGRAADAPMGNGTRNLAERARQLGGELVLTAAVPHGTELSWTARL